MTRSLSVLDRIALTLLVCIGIVLCSVSWAGIYRLGRADAQTVAHETPTVGNAVYYGEAPTIDIAAPAVAELAQSEGPLYFQAPLPDVLEQPVESVDLVNKLWQNGQIAQAIIVVAFLALTLASRRISWLSEGHRAVYVAAVLTGLGMLAETASRGTTPNASMIIGALMVSMTLVLNGKAPGQVAAGLPIARALRSPPAIAIDPRPRRRELEHTARELHAGFVASMGVEQSWEALGDHTREHWIAAAAKVHGA